MSLKSYLANRSQKVAIKEALSELDDLKAGVPQGSVLDPMLFLVFINDIADDMLVDFLPTIHPLDLQP
jgi:hypothetical protein